MGFIYDASAYIFARSFVFAKKCHLCFTIRKIGFPIQDSKLDLITMWIHYPTAWDTFLVFNVPVRLIPPPPVFITVLLCDLRLASLFLIGGGCSDQKLY